MRFTRVAGALLTSLLAACTSTASVNREPHSGTGTASLTGGVQQITLTTGADYRFHPSTVVVHPGRVRVVLVNQGKEGAGAPHNWSLTGFAAAFVPTTPAGTRAEATFTAPAPGQYQFVCTIHARQGQTGTLVVKPGSGG